MSQQEVNTRTQQPSSSTTTSPRAGPLSKRNRSDSKADTLPAAVEATRRDRTSAIPTTPRVNPVVLSTVSNDGSVQLVDKIIDEQLLQLAQKRRARDLLEEERRDSDAAIERIRLLMKIQQLEQQRQHTPRD